MPSANNTVSKYVSIVLVFKSTAKKKKEENSFYLILFISLLNNMTLWILFEGKRSLTAAAAAQEYI